MSKLFLLDTNICIYLIRKKPAQVLKHIQKRIPSEIGISIITQSELQYGVEKSQFRERNQVALNHFLGAFSIFPFEHRAALHFAKLRAELEKRGNQIGPFDLLIAAHALALSATLVTNNEREFSRVRNLKIENWAS